ncbi:otoferlin-like [Diadema antillarum]|uniref:otoferlin-like n=1 Tax=Diadema antillarum TaxID=105358 RepID=UPI003A84FF01
MTVDKPRCDIEVGGHTIQSSIVVNAQRNPNFPNNVQILDVDLPENDLYCPPLTIRLVDCRQFGRFTLVGTHVVGNLSSYKLVEKEDEEPVEQGELATPVVSTLVESNITRIHRIYTIQDSYSLLYFQYQNSIALRKN